MKMWSGRFRQPLNPDFERWQRSFPFDQRLLGEELAASKAHARALAGIGVLSADELKKVEDGLKTIAQQAATRVDYLNDEDAEDVHHFVEKHLVAHIGETGYKLHSGRSRNEQIATDLRLHVRTAIDRLHLLLTGLLEALVEKAERSGEAVMPAYTHLQKAEPVLVAHWLLAYAEMFSRDIGRLAECRVRLNLCPLGSGALAGATLPLDRKAMAQELGFDGPTANSLDATSDRDFGIEFVQALALLAVHMSRFAEEMIIFSTQEFAFVQLPEAYSTGSSAMPQKKNPDAMELIRGKAARVISAANSLLITVKGTPLAYNKDFQETQQPIFDAAEQSLEMVKTLSGFVKTVELDYAEMQAAAETGYMNALAAASCLVKQGVPFRRAHEHIGNAVRMGLERGCELQDLPLEELKKLAPEFNEGFYDALQLRAVLDCHDVIGGTAVEQVKAALVLMKNRVSALKGGLHAYA
ncbi:MAG TPA: argininosuccinate lyase [Terriglobales bacterium]|nr:argininosuccinate lyase [Terriglobales bacterium]